MQTLPTAKVTESLKQLFIATFKASIEPLKVIEQFQVLLFQLGIPKEKLDEYLSIFDWKVLDDKDKTKPLVFEVSTLEKDTYTVEKDEWHTTEENLADIINNHTIIDVENNDVAKRFLERTTEKRFLIERAEIKSTEKSNESEIIFYNYEDVHKWLTPVCDTKHKDIIATLDSPFVIGGDNFSMRVRSVWAGTKYTIKLYPYAEFKIPITRKVVLDGSEKVIMPIVCGENEFVEIMMPENCKPILPENEMDIEAPTVISIAPTSLNNIECFMPLAENGWGTIHGEFLYKLIHIAMIRLDYSEEVIQTLSVSISRTINGEKIEKHYKISDYLDENSMTLEACLLKFKSPIPFDGNTRLTIGGHKGKLFKLYLHSVKPNGLWADFDKCFEAAEPLSVDEQREKMYQGFSKNTEPHLCSLNISGDDWIKFQDLHRQDNLKLLGKSEGDKFEVVCEGDYYVVFKNGIEWRRYDYKQSNE